MLLSLLRMERCLPILLEVHLIMRGIRIIVLHSLVALRLSQSIRHGGKVLEARRRERDLGLVKVRSHLLLLMRHIKILVRSLLLHLQLSVHLIHIIQGSHANLRHHLIRLALVSDHDRLPHHLSLLEDMNNFWIDYRDTLGGTAVYLLLYYHMAAILGRELVPALFFSLRLTRELHTRCLRPHGMSEELVQIEPCKLVADRGAL